MLITRETKNAHFITAQIPDNLWNLFFLTPFDITEIKVANKTFAELNRDDLPKIDTQAFIIMLLAYPGTQAEHYMNFAQNILKLDKRAIFKLSLYMKCTSILRWFKNNWSDESDFTAEEGYLQIYNVLNSLMGYNESPQVKRSDVLCLAAAYGFLNILDWWKKQISIDEFNFLIKNKFYGVFLYAAANGFIDILTWLKELTPEHFNSMVECYRDELDYWFCSNNYLRRRSWNHKYTKLRTCFIWHKDFYWHSVDGHLATLIWLKELIPDNEFKLLVEKKYDELFIFSAINGHLATLQWLTRQMSNEFQIKNKALNFFAFRCAAEKNHLNVLEWFGAQLTNDLNEMIRSKYYYVFRKAAENGFLHILKWLHEQAPFQFKLMLKAKRFDAFNKAARYGHLNVLQWIKEQDSNLFEMMLSNKDFYAFWFSVAKKHDSITNWLLFDSSCFAHAEQSRPPYNVEPFIQERIQELYLKSELLFSIYSNTVFDLDNPDLARLCFYMIRAMIRRNDRKFDPMIRFLPNIPAVNALAHQEVSRNKPNELIRLALSVGNAKAAVLLLNIDEVRYKTVMNNYYVNSEQNLVAIDPESSMKALSANETDMVKAAYVYYAPKIKQIGLNETINSLQHMLITRYGEKPAKISTSDHQEINLPCHFDELMSLNLLQSDYEQAMKAYYQHTVHTAWRFLVNPNPWLHRETDQGLFYTSRQ